MLDLTVSRNLDGYDGDNGDPRQEEEEIIRGNPTTGAGAGPNVFVDYPVGITE